MSNATGEAVLSNFFEIPLELTPRPAAVESRALRPARAGADLDDHAGHVVAEVVLAGEVAHGPVEGLDDPARGLVAMGPDDLDRAIEAE